MTGTSNGVFSFFEIAVLLIVVIATISFQIPPEEKQSEQFQTSTITGTIELSTRSAMNSLGLNEFNLGPLATVDLTTIPVYTENCQDCQSLITGINIQGSVIITELIDQNDRQGRVEAELNLTYLRESNTDDLIYREWIIFDWDAGDISSKWEIYIVHDPPRWSPKSANYASFFETDNGLMTRSGPEISIQILGNNKTSIQGCLPDSFLCRASSPDANLVTTFYQINQPILLEQPSNWSQYNITQTQVEPEGTLPIREFFELDQPINQTKSWCPIIDQSILTSKAWAVSTSQATIAPLSSWLSALSIPTNSFTPSGNIWSETEFLEFSCSTLTDQKGQLNLGILVEYS